MQNFYEKMQKFYRGGAVTALLWTLRRSFSLLTTVRRCRIMIPDIKTGALGAISG